MALRTMPVDEFLKKVLTESFALGESRFAQVSEPRKKKIMLSTFTQLGSVVPEQFLSFVETLKDPRALVERVFTKMNGLPPPYQILLESGDLDREHFLEEVAVQTVLHIIAQIFLAPPETNEYSPFMQDLKELHTYLKIRMAETATQKQNPSNEENGNGEYSRKVDLGPDDKEQLVQRFSQSLISVSALFRKNADPAINTGQYL
ncbi:MAG: hypothetical protein HYW90_02445 [Candidatus Sungbacteria bacterium]|nr:hypothetical protein [Candidatus Sungbacteria bacterium]